MSRHASAGGGVFFARNPRLSRSPLFEIALVLVRFDHVVSVIVNANHRVPCTTAENRLTGKTCAQSARGIIRFAAKREAIRVGPSIALTRGILGIVGSLVAIIIVVSMAMRQM